METVWCDERCYTDECVYTDGRQCVYKSVRNYESIRMCGEQQELVAQKVQNSKLYLRHVNFLRIADCGTV